MEDWGRLLESARLCLEKKAKRAQARQAAAAPCLIYLASHGRRLQQLVQWPLHAPRLAARLGLGGPRGVLLYGPPGTGKTLLVRALAGESRLNLIAVHIPQLLRAEVRASEHSQSHNEHVRNH